MASPSEHSSYRDRIATADEHGRRIWIYPHQPKGKFYRARTIVSWFLLAFLFGAPFIRLGGNPLLQFDFINRKFFIFGLIFWPQDFFIFVLATIALVVMIILFTAAFGRLFCGWICPQTVFLEMVFRKIEYLIEGNGPRQRELARAPMSGSKFAKKSLKHLIFFGLSFLIGNIFLAYIIGTNQLRTIVTSSPMEHLTGFVAMLIFSGLFYFVFAWFREQACTLVCPYGRLQSVLLDSNTIVIAYDFKRGEPRGPAAKNADFTTRGHCIDCAACVKVCPTGIDIRNGTQLECVNCTACIDACDRVMERMKLPTGLIRYSSYNRVAEGKPMSFTPRMGIYTGVLVVLLGLIGYFMLGRSAAEVTILRTTGSLYEEIDGGIIRNLYTVSIINKSNDSLPIRLELKSPAGELRVVGPQLRVAPEGSDQSVITIEIPRKDLYTSNTMVTIDVYTGAKLLEEVNTTFAGPEPHANDDQNKESHDKDHD